MSVLRTLGLMNPQRASQEAHERDCVGLAWVISDSLICFGLHCTCTCICLFD